LERGESKDQAVYRGLEKAKRLVNGKRTALRVSFL
jgi:hypothetical protein